MRAFLGHAVCELQAVQQSGAAQAAVALRQEVETLCGTFSVPFRTHNFTPLDTHSSTLSFRASDK